MQQGGPALRALGLGDLLGQHGAVSTNHTSYRWDGTRLGTYGLSKRKPCEGNSTHPAVEPTPAAPQHEESEGKPVKEGLLKSKTRHNVHIPRQKLREIMLQSIHPDNIRWNKKLSTVEMRSGAEISSASVAGVSSAAERHVKLKFEDGTEEEVSALVGADGIYSSVRKALASVGDADQLSARRTDDLKYLGLMVILGIASNPTAEETAAAGAAAFTRTQRQWLDGETRVFSMPYDKDHTMWQLSYPCAEADAIALSTIALHESESSGATKSDILKDEALRRCAGWAPDLVALLSRSERGLVSGHPVYDRDPGALNIIRSLEETIEGEESPVISERVSNWPITLLGDAAHPMSPFKGQGANQAILDALALSRAISSSNLFVPARAKTDGQTGSHRRGIAENLRLYEQDMYAKAAEKVQRSRDAAFYLHNESALAEGNVTRAKAAEDFALSLQSADA
jgi:2-polyprenyl-6-methoxyphenol hydroxylase-like FAD-dependent oxidoreductase